MSTFSPSLSSFFIVFLYSLHFFFFKKKIFLISSLTLWSFHRSLCDPLISLLHLRSPPSVHHPCSPPLSTLFASITTYVHPFKSSTDLTLLDLPCSQQFICDFTSVSRRPSSHLFNRRPPRPVPICQYLPFRVQAF